jgi:hypothetical protein
MVYRQTILFLHLIQGCIFWPFSTLSGREDRHFLKFGEENRPRTEKNLIVEKKNCFLQANVFQLQLQLY